MTRRAQTRELSGTEREIISAECARQGRKSGTGEAGRFVQQPTGCFRRQVRTRRLDRRNWAVVSRLDWRASAASALMKQGEAWLLEPRVLMDNAREGLELKRELERERRGY